MYYYDITDCSTGKGFITHADWLTIPGIEIVGAVALMDGDIRDTGPWAVRVGAVEMTAPQIAEYLAAKMQTEVVTATQERLDTFARTRNYDSILSACTYATSSVPTFATEGQYAVTARDATWAALYALLADVQAGKAPMPTGFADIEPLLPALVWPV